MSIMRVCEKPAVRGVEFLKEKFGWHTYQVEYAFVVSVLVITVLVTGNGFNMWKWVEAAAVMLTFMHMKISQRMAEKEERAQTSGGKVRTEYYWKLEPIFMGKEILWVVTLAHLQAWAALVGTFLFLLYYPWRETWRKSHPLKD